jgi:hypothetical protein
MALSWSESAGRFVDARGRFVDARPVVNDIADGASARMAAASERMLAGDLSLAEWQAEMMRTVKLSQLAASTIAHGGTARMGFPEYGAAGREIRNQYDYLRTFAAQVASGEQPLNGGLLSRARQYGQAARVTFEREYSRDQRNRGYQMERNVLHPAEHCAVCVSESARGWVPIGSLIPIGSRTCRANDRCTVAYSKDAAAAA